MTFLISRKRRKVGKKQRRLVKYVAGGGLLVVLLLAILAGWLFFRSRETGEWDGEHNFNLVYGTVKDGAGGGLVSLALVAFDPLEGEVVTVFIPDNIMISVPGGYGDYRAEAVFNLDQLEGKGGQLLRKSVSGYFAVPIDGWVIGKPLDSQGNLAEICWSLAKGQGRSSMGWLERIRLWRKVALTKGLNYKVLNIAESGAVEVKELADGSRVLETDLRQLDDWLDDYLADAAIRGGGIEVAVLNSTDYTGMAGRVSRLMTNVGFEVVMMGAYDEKDKPGYCLIKADPALRDSYALKKLKEMFGCELSLADTRQFRAELAVIVGEQFAREIYSGSDEE